MSIPYKNDLEDPEIEDISCPEAHKLWGHPGTVFVDVRERREFQYGVLPGALLRPLSEMTPAQLLSITAENCIIYCRTGSRVHGHASMWEQIACKHIYNLRGGVMAWVGHGFDLQSIEGIQDL